MFTLLQDTLLEHFIAFLLMNIQHDFTLDHLRMSI